MGSEETIQMRRGIKDGEDKHTVDDRNRFEGRELS